MNMENQSQKISVRAVSPSAGFTLVELMVVVAIIGILAAVAGPRVQQFRARGVQSEAKANLNSIYLAQAAFQDANDRFAIAGQCDNAGACDGADGAAFAYRTNNGSKYRYNVLSEADGGRWAAGAASRQRILRNQKDVWRVNTNKDLCAFRDVVLNTAKGAAGACDGGVPDVNEDTGVTTLADIDNPT
jgi:prepilin-type N-terminal cleavage/methylation domain-containing protein